MKAGYRIVQNESGLHYFELLGKNGQRLFRCDLYLNRQSCLNGINAMRNGCKDMDRFPVKKSANGDFHFLFLAPNGQIIGASITFETEKKAIDGIKKVIEIAKDAPMLDED